jgi:hypothetical protein
LLFQNRTNDKTRISRYLKINAQNIALVGDSRDKKELGGSKNHGYDIGIR